MFVKTIFSFLILTLSAAVSAGQNTMYGHFRGDPAAFLNYLKAENDADFVVIDPDSLSKLKAKDVAFLIKNVNSRQAIPAVYSEYSTSMWARKHTRSTIGVEAMRWIYAFRKEKKYPWLKYPSAASGYDAVVSRHRNNVNVPKRIKVAEVKIWWFLNRKRLLRH